MKAFTFVSLFLTLVLHAGRFASIEALAVGPSTKKSFGGYDYPNLYEETIPMLWTSKLVYSFACLLKAGREGKLDLGDTFPPEVLAAYKDERLDVRGLEGEHGLPFNKVAEIVRANADWLAENVSDAEYVGGVIEELQAIEDADESSDSLFLETFASLEQATQCVYGVLKDENNKRVIVVFRGSSTSNDWLTNLSAQPTGMDTPKLLKDSLKGKLKKRVLVHRGFYEYIFNNKKAKGDQRYDMILDDIKPFVEDGYKIYVTGHSLGAALSSLLAFKLAGSDLPWIPKPVTCISFASPFAGTDGFRTAFTILEEKGLIRYLRVNNDGDTVPTIPPFSLGRKRLMKHVGINLRLSKNKFILSHPNSNGLGVVNAMRNSVLKPVWSVLKYHGFPMHQERLDAHKEELQSMYLNDLYADEKLMGKDFKREEL